MWCRLALPLTHPTSLNGSTAGWWRDLHLLLLPLFPLLAVNVWWLLGRKPGLLAWSARILAFVYLVGYGALDVLFGIAAGALVDAGLSPGNEALSSVFGLGSGLARVGVLAVLGACLLTSVVLLRDAGPLVLPGVVLLCGSAYVFMGTHVYWPEGGLAQLGIAAGCAWLALVGPAPPAPAPDQQAAPEPAPLAAP